MNVWYCPTEYSPACLHSVSESPQLQQVLSACGFWKTKVDLRRAIPARGAPDFEVCPTCARLARFTPRPTTVVEVKPRLLSPEERIPLEDVRGRAIQDDPTDELAGVDLGEL